MLLSFLSNLKVRGRLMLSGVWSLQRGLLPSELSCLAGHMPYALLLRSSRFLHPSIGLSKQDFYPVNFLPPAVDVSSVA